MWSGTGLWAIPVVIRFRKLSPPCREFSTIQTRILSIRTRVRGWGRPNLLTRNTGAGRAHARAVRGGCITGRGSPEPGSACWRPRPGRGRMRNFGWTTSDLPIRRISQVLPVPAWFRPPGLIIPSPHQSTTLLPPGPIDPLGLRRSLRPSLAVLLRSRPARSCRMGPTMFQRQGPYRTAMRQPIPTPSS